MPFRIPRDQRQLTHQILDVMQNEGEATVEFLKPLRVGQRFLAVRLSQSCRSLAAGGAQEVEIFPVESAADFRSGEQDEADQPLVMDQRYARPSPAVGCQP